MIDLNKNYWFYLEPYVYGRIENDNVLLYNTLDSSSIEETNKDIVMLINDLLEKKNNGVILLSYELLSNKEIANFIDAVRSRFFGDIIDITLSKLKPIQLVPQLNLQRDIARYSKKNQYFLNEIDLTYLHEITIYLNGFPDKKFFQNGGFPTFFKNTSNHNEQSLIDLISFLDPISKSGLGNLQIWGNDLFEYSYFDHLLKFLSIFPSKKTLVINNFQIDLSKLYYLKSGDFEIQLCIYYPVNEDLIRRIIFELSLLDIRFNVLFMIRDEIELASAEDLLSRLEMKEYLFQPFYTGNNIEFFRKYVFLKKEDILLSTLTMKEIFSRQKLNSYFFGKLEILPNGDVYSNTYFPKLGNIKSETLSEIVRKEFFEGGAWLKIRNNHPCIHCVYQWLCPSPSNYELAIGKPNLCHVIE